MPTNGNNSSGGEWPDWPITALIRLLLDETLDQQPISDWVD